MSRLSLACSFQDENSIRKLLRAGSVRSPMKKFTLPRGLSKPTPHLIQRVSMSPALIVLPKMAASVWSMRRSST